MSVFFSSGNTLIDLVVGGASGVMGFPSGRFINICGDKSAGKSLCAMELLAAAYYKYPKKEFRWVYDDCESGNTFDTKRMYGFSVVPENSKDIIRSDTVEEAFVNISNFANSLTVSQYGIYILDSLDGLTSTEQDDQAKARVKAYNSGKEYDKGSYGMGKPKYLSREFFPQLCGVIQDKNILVIIISQVRENVVPFSFEKYKRSGGKALDFYSHSVLWLATLKKIVKRNKSVGVVIKAKTTKSKTPRPFRECVFSIIFDYGVDDIGSNLDFLYDLRTDKGELTPAAKAITWNESTSDKKHSLKDVKAFLKSIDNKATGRAKSGQTTMYDVFLQDRKPTLPNMLEFLDTIPALKKSYEKLYGGDKGVIYSRDDLIAYIEDSGTENILRDRVALKWEEIESSIASKRKKRYATQPEGIE
jgi:RecA/RadA recombinase